MPNTQVTYSWHLTIEKFGCLNKQNIACVCQTKALDARGLKGLGNDHLV
jgi:hypothetical protein